MATGVKRAVSATANILEVGQVLGGRFEIQEMLGIGGMGAVYKAYDRDIDRVIALKCIRPELAKDPEIAQRFTQELLLARQIAHKNIIRIFDVRDSGGLKFITMEYVEGQDLGNRVESRGKLTIAESVAIIMQVCSGLACAHAEGVVHRDLKPSNIMVDPQGRVVVMDFGLARADNIGQMTQTGAVMGTYQYMSPEQAKGTKADARSDIFTVGIILYELLTGKTPYAADSAMASLLKRTQEAAVPPSQIDSAVPRPLSAIVAKCLERDVPKRYQTADDLRNELKAFNGGSTVSLSAPRISGKMLGLVASFVLAGLIAVAGIVKWSSSSGGGAATIAHPAVKVLLADFQNNTSDSVFDGTLESSFALAMEGAPFISAYNRTQARKTLTTIDPAANLLNEAGASLVALREGVNVVISGAVEKLGNGYKISCKAVDPVSSKTLGSAETETNAKSGVLQAVAQLADKMRRLLGDTTPESARLQQQETVTSSSLEAVHEYAVAQDLQFSSKWEEALPHYSRAIALDPNMGRAYAGMAVMSANMGRKADAEKYYQTAMAHIDRMSDREKYRTRGGYYLMTRQPDKAIQEYNALVEQYPADAVGPTNLALSYFFTRDMQKAMEQGRRSVVLSPKAVLQRTNLALYSIYAGDYASGAKAAQEVLNANPSSADALGALAIAQTGEGDFSSATATYKKLEALSPRGASMSNIGLADIAELQGRNDEAVTLLEKGIAADVAAKESASAAAKTIALGQAYLSQGNKKKALNAAESAVKLDPQPNTLMAAGELYVSAGDTARAAKLVTQLSARIEPEPQLYGALLQGAISLSRGQRMEAIQSFEKAQKISNSWLGHFYLGKAYLQNGSFTEADSEFELCLKRSGEASAVFLDDVPTFRLVPPVYYFLARAQEGLKSPSAGETYRAFLKMQPDGSSELITDARHRLEAH
ncbi:MAG: Serine/threonine-protein kinase PknB [Candidatus Angelobacter sp.]|nr:Serine/threonine-protein kinase PknB [Candidatus Angelobacter sp.]